MFSLAQNIHYKPPVVLQNQWQVQQASFLQGQGKRGSNNFKLGGAMIDRIHFIRPGCGSCGK